MCASPKPSRLQSDITWYRRGSLKERLRRSWNSSSFVGTGPPRLSNNVLGMLSMQVSHPPHAMLPHAHGHGF